MILAINFSSDIPIYQQIRDQVVEGIAFGNLADGETLPSTRQLASDLGINFQTVNKAYELLRQERLIRLNRKSGAVVTRDRQSGDAPDNFVAGWTGRLRTLLAEGLAQGMDIYTVLENCQRILQSAEGENS